MDTYDDRTDDRSRRARALLDHLTGPGLVHRFILAEILGPPPGLIPSSGVLAVRRPARPRPTGGVPQDDQTDPSKKAEGDG
ncbi:MAG: hypothetical protein J7M25_11890 [Deltaproteobacteria bacterium]|nr:hypothetical protein [Deltaproteobacteria bacterium]